MKKRIALVLVLILMVFALCSCHKTSSGTTTDNKNTIAIANKLAINQPTPVDIEYSLERYNLIRRAYWVNGMRERANTLPCEIDKPLGYIVLFSGNAIVGSFVVDGKVSSLNSFLSPDSEYYSGETVAISLTRRDGTTSGSNYSYVNRWLADVDGSYGENDSGIFFFTPDGKYIEWTGDYLYSDIPFTVDAPMVHYEVNENE